LEKIFEAKQSFDQSEKTVKFDSKRADWCNSLIWRKCTTKSIKTYVPLVLPASILKLNGGTRMEMLLRQRRKRLAAKQGMS